jgi:hypothetical protein
VSLKLLIDECLSPELVELAVAAGHVESSCIRDRGWLHMKDWDLMRLVVASDWTLVTHNARDFRGPGSEAPGGHHARQDIHAGLVCLNSAFPMSLDRQHRLFSLALEELAGMKDLVNLALEVTEHADRSIDIDVYEIPPP